MIVALHLLATAASTLPPSLPPEPAPGYRAGVMLSPLGGGGAGIALGASAPARHLSLNAEAGLFSMGGLKAWAGWLEWKPLTSGGHAAGLMAGYSQGTGVAPGPAMVTARPADPPGAIVGLAYEWTRDDFFVRLRPHLAFDLSMPYWHPGPTMKSLFVGPPLLELGWRLTPKLELGLRLSAMPLSASWFF